MIIKEKKSAPLKKGIILCNSTPGVLFRYPFFLSVLLNEMMCDKTTLFKSFMFMCNAFYLFSEANPVRQEDHSTVYTTEILVEGNIQSA